MSDLDGALNELVFAVKAEVRAEVVADVRAELRREMEEEASKLGKRFIKIDEVCRKLACSESTLHRLRHSQKGFPKPRHGVDGAPRWIASEIEDWMDAHVGAF